MIAVLVAIVQRLYDSSQCSCIGGGKGVTEAEVDHTATDGELLRAIMASVQRLEAKDKVRAGKAAVACEALRASTWPAGSSARASVDSIK